MISSVCVWVVKLENMERIADDLYFVKYIHREGSFVGITVVLGRQTIGLVDTGFEATIETALFPFLQDVERSPDEIDVVVNTHRDGDHVQGNPVIKGCTKATIAIPARDADGVKGIDVTLQDGDRVGLGDRQFEVIHTPGHTPGNICLYHQDDQLLIVGDTLCGDMVNLIRMDASIYIASIKRLLDFDINVLIQSHPRKPVGKAILDRAEAREMMMANIALAENVQ
jgi:glyoxylase-like metal-dependent hydrolase (beta-lactamase superfamily II)